MNGKKHAPEIQVGIFSGEEIYFTLNTFFRPGNEHDPIEGSWKAKTSSDKIIIQKDDTELVSEDLLILVPIDSGIASFTLHDVTIGVDFHWQRKEDQIFKGKLRLFTENGKLFAVNVLSIEDYLTSVISSEMSATSSSELLKAHAVISRSWLLAQIEKSHSLNKAASKHNANIRTDDEIIRWYDREDHKNFDVCADDHCQRYQGITRSSTPVVEQVIKETFGEVLAYNGEICDTRYYKCCGGITELFENVWEPVNHPYLRKVVDNPSYPQGYDLDLEREENAEKWILGKPESFCNTTDKKILSQVLNDYDQETKDFYRWRVSYTQEELSELVKIRTGIDFGTITDLDPLERGVSGRILRLKIQGTKKTMVIGKELEIRKALSKSHLYSSCFIVEKLVVKKETTFILHGAGWGHGVGLCQIGAAVMGAKGYSYHEILMHYFRDAVLEKRY
jgi:stage II sporulation protein D